MNVIADIYRNSNKPSERGLKKDNKYRKAKNRVNQYYRLLSERLTEQEKAVLDKFILWYDKKTERKNMYCFENGFKTGLAAAIESLEKNGN